MKRKKKKYNPLKKYQEGGEVKETKPNPKSAKWDEKSSGAFDAYMAGMASAEKDAEPEDLMKGRTFIPRMSESQRQAIMDGSKKLMDKMRAKREEKKEKKLADTRKEKYEATDSEIYDDSPVDSDEMLSMPEEEYAKYGAKILKKYANGGKTDPPKKRDPEKDRNNREAEKAAKAAYRRNQETKGETDPKRPTKAKIEAARKERKKDLRTYKTGKKIRKKENQIDAIKDRAAYKNLKMKIKESKR